MELQLKDLYDGFRDAKAIHSLAELINSEALYLKEPLRVMEVCGGHTHTIMKYGLKQLLPENITFVHGPGCPVCIMPKERIDHAITLAKQKDVILVTLGDMIRVPGSLGTLAEARAQGCDVRALYSPLDALSIAKENPDKTVIYFAIGFETTTPMSAALLDKLRKENIDNFMIHVNHVLVPPPVHAIMDSGKAVINAFIGPSHVSVITGAKIYQPLAEQYATPVAVSGFEPVDVMQGILMLVRQKNEGRSEVEIQYTRAVDWEGNQKAQELINTYFETRESFRWRGIGDIPKSALQLREEYAGMDAEVVYQAVLPTQKVDDHKLCICAEILMGIKQPKDCTVFDKACSPSNPLGSCMVSSEGACNAYYRYAR